MKLKVTLRRGGSSGTTTNLLISADGTTRASDLAQALALSDPLGPAAPGPPDRLTLRTVDSSGHPRTIDPDATLLESGLRSGSVIELALPVVRTVGGPAATLAVVRILDGPDTGKEFPLGAGAFDVGRAPGLHMQLTDPLVSKQHARIHVGDGVEVLDTNSSNGVIVGGVKVGKVRVGPDDIVTLGNSRLSITHLRPAGPLESTTTDTAFVRPSVVVPRVPERTVELPDAPRSQTDPRFPWLAMVAPLVMGAALFAMTRSPLSLIFVALSPVLMLGNFIDQRIQTKKKREADAVIFEADLAQARLDLKQDHADERAALLAMHPSLAEVAESTSRLGTLLWCRRPEHPQFLQIRLGLGSVDARVEIEGRSRGGLPEPQRRANELATTYATLTDAPIVADLKSVGGLGLVGQPDALDGVSRGVVLQLIGLHSPAEVVLACLTSPRGRDRWGWLEWLPHISSAHSPLGGSHLSADPGTGLVLLAQLEELISVRTSSRTNSETAPRGPITGDEKTSTPVLPTLVLLVDEPSVDQARLNRVAERGADVGVHVLWCARSRAELPAVCRTFLELGPGGASVGEVRRGRTAEQVVCESIDLAAVSALARHLSPVVDAGAPVDDESDLPRAVPLVTLFGADAVDDPEVVLARWRENQSLVPRDGRPPVPLRHVTDLRALVGHAGTEPFTLALRTQGPHALVGGTTGAGKSEFLQSWVLGMAHAYSPDRITFLFVDYKGGAAFARCTDLPHAVGLVTDLSPALVRRVLRSLRAELHYRERLLNTKGAKDLVELEKSGDPECPPSLVIVVDEFAALAGEVPEFVDGVVDVAQRGRSLGLHLILATQRPAGVIKDNLRANTNLRVALRMADEHDSVDVIGEKLAAHFSPSVPGRGAAKMGPGRITPFQSAFPGSRTPAQPPAPPIDVSEMVFGPGDAWQMPERATTDDSVDKDIDRLVSTLAEAARRGGVPTPRRPWLDSLSNAYDLQRMSPRSDAELVLGVIDDPDHQKQSIEHFRPDAEGNILFYGAGGSGKSTALRTLAIGASITPRSAGAHLYALDFGGGGLGMLAPLPNVGAVINGDDEERVSRLIRWLSDLVDSRAARYSAQRASTLTEFREAGHPDEQRIIVLIDGLGTFRTEYEGTTARLPIYNAFQRLLADGRAVGVHFAMTADRPGVVSTAVAAAVQRKVVLRQTDEDAYRYFNLPADVLNPTSPPGRAMQGHNPQELQVAVFGDSVNLAAQARAIEELAAFNRTLNRPAPEPVRTLPELVPAEEVPSTTPGRGGEPLPVLGISDDTLAPIGFAPAGVILLSGPAQSGRTNTVLWLANALRRWQADLPLFHLSARRSPLSGLPLWDACATGVDDCGTLATNLRTVVDAQSTDGGPLAAIFVEYLPDFLTTLSEQPILELVKACRRNGHLLVAEGETTSWNNPWPLLMEVRNGRTGLLLQPDQTDGDILLRTSLPRVKRTDLPPGRGFFVNNGRAQKLQVPLADG